MEEGRNVVARITGRISATQLDNDEEPLMCAVRSVPSQDFWEWWPPHQGSCNRRHHSSLPTHSWKPECKLRGPTFSVRQRPRQMRSHCTGPASVQREGGSARQRQCRRRTGQDDLESRVRRGETLVHVGEVSSARRWRLAPKPRWTNCKMCAGDLLNRGSRCPQGSLDEKLFGRNLRSARRGVPGGPSGMTCEHLRPLLDERRAMQLLFKLGENLARGHVPQVVESMVRSGRMTALSKPDGGVRGIVSEDVFRRLVARTMAQQLGPAVKSATAPHQYALSTRAGCECIPSATVTLIDGVGAFDSISRRAMLTRLAQVSGGASTLPFVRMFYGSPSQYLWDDDDGVSHTIPARSGGSTRQPESPNVHI